MKTCSVLKALWTPVQCQFVCSTDGAAINGIIWDLSATGCCARQMFRKPFGMEELLRAVRYELAH